MKWRRSSRNNLRSVTKTRDDCAEEFAGAERDFLRAAHEHKAAVKAFESISARLGRLSLNSTHGLPGSPFKPDASLIVLLFRHCSPETTPGSAPSAGRLTHWRTQSAKPRGALSVHKKVFEDHV